MNTAQWIKEAEEQARKYSDAIKNNNQYVIDQLNASKTNTLNQLQNQQNQALYNLNANQSTINQNAEDAAKQANINRLLALRDNNYAMNRAGLGTQGVVGSQVNSINNNYGTNLSSILNEKNNQVNDLLKQRQELNTTYDNNRLNLENEYANNIANMQSAINDKALNQYNNVYNNYLSLKQEQYDNEQAELARQEAIRQYNEKMAYQRERDAVADQQWAKEYALSRSTANARYGSGSSSSASLTNGSTSNQTDIFGNNSTTMNKSDYYFKKADGSYTDQPSYIGNTRLSTNGITAGDIGVTGAGIGSGYRIWQANGNYYVWDNNNKTYVDVTNEYKKATK